ncbi:MAG TPA: hypothetical protein VMM56_14540 [Planctomycetaceae bacterium]|nr:hypothetical protein [Planctomycetaceae bacterium]
MMIRRMTLIRVFAATVLGLTVAVPTSFAQTRERQTEQAKPEANANTHSGEVAGTSEGQLKMTIGGQKEHSHTISDRTEITIDGQPARLNDLRRGDVIQVTLGENNVALSVKTTRQSKQATRQPTDQPGQEPSECSHARCTCRRQRLDAGAATTFDGLRRGPVRIKGKRERLLSRSSMRAGWRASLNTLTFRARGFHQPRFRFHALSDHRADRHNNDYFPI